MIMIIISRITADHKTITFNRVCVSSSFINSKSPNFYVNLSLLFFFWIQHTPKFYWKNLCNNSNEIQKKNISSSSTCNCWVLLSDHLNATRLDEKLNVDGNSLCRSLRAVLFSLFVWLDVKCFNSALVSIFLSLLLVFSLSRTFERSFKLLIIHKAAACFERQLWCDLWMINLLTFTYSPLDYFLINFVEFSKFIEIPHTLMRLTSVAK